MERLTSRTFDNTTGPSQLQHRTMLGGARPFQTEVVAIAQASARQKKHKGPSVDSVWRHNLDADYPQLMPLFTRGCLVSAKTPSTQGVCVYRAIACACTRALNDR